MSQSTNIKTMLQLAILGSIILAFLTCVGAEEINVCKYLSHFTDPMYTCCANVRYQSPEIYTDEDLSNKCLKVTSNSSNQLVYTMWSYYRCLLEQKIGKEKEINFDTIHEVLGKNLPLQVQANIKLRMKELKNSTNYYYAHFADKPAMEPFRTLATAWNAYYKAENRVCNDRTTNNHFERDENMSDKKPYCRSLILRYVKRGDCCNMFPLPLQLSPQSLLRLNYSELKSFTAKTFMAMTGNYKFQNETLASNRLPNSAVQICLQAATLVKKGSLKPEIVKTWTTSPLVSKTFDATIHSIIPNYLFSLKDIILKIARKSAGLTTDKYIQMFSNFSMDGRNLTFVKEYADDEKFNLNGTRLLLSNCRAVELALISYHFLNVTELCFAPRLPPAK